MMRNILLGLAKRPAIGRWVTRHGVTRRMARRFIAGETIKEAVAAVRTLNNQEISATLDCLGENVREYSDAERSRQTYFAMLERIKQSGINANVSLKLTQLGLDLGDDFCAEMLESIVMRSAEFGNFVRVDMEGSAYAVRTIDIVMRLRREYDNLGVVLQAYLYRSESDLKRLLQMDCRVRLCKGAYRESSVVAYPRKQDVDANFVRLAAMLLSSGIYHGIATHDPKMIDAAAHFAARNGIPKNSFEFQMLCGIRSDLQRQLVADGYRVRVYVPFGTEWFGYFMRRLAERPANLFFLLRNLLR
jgi:proline dehydrogenase